jgi:tyrosinase
VLVFVGAFDETNAESWDTTPAAVGRVSILGRSPETKCGKCQNDIAGSLMVSGTVPLTSALLGDIIDGGRLSSLEPEDVVPYLKANLKWKVTLFTGVEKNASEVPGLKVSVVSTKVTIGNDGLPSYSGEYTCYPEITAGVPGGLNPGEQ